MSSAYGLARKLLPRLGFLSQMDARYSRKISAKGTKRYPPLFIVGAPRTGTTILYQSLLTRFPLTYISNVESMLFTTPTLAHRWTHNSKDSLEDKGDKNVYGYVKGLTGPSEAGAFMRYFLDDAAKRRKDFDTRLQAMAVMSDRPVLSKNTFNTYRIDKIYEAIPDAFIIWITREHDSLHKSIMTMRKTLGGESAEWVGAGQPEADVLEGMTISDQVTYQINSITDTLNTALTKDRPHVIVKYEDFCSDREQVLDNIMKVYFHGQIKV